MAKCIYIYPGSRSKAIENQVGFFPEKKNMILVGIKIINNFSMDYYYF